MAFILVFLFLFGPVLEKTIAEPEAGEGPIAHYERLRKDIIARPVIAQKIPPEFSNNFTTKYPLTFRLLLVNIYDIDEINQVMSVVVYMELEWTHRELSWNSSEYGGINWVNMETDNLWTPTLLVAMGLKDSFLLDYPKYVVLYDNGAILGVKHYFLSFSCQINIEKFPFDRQTCGVNFQANDANPLPNVTIEDTKYARIMTDVYFNGAWEMVDFESEVFSTYDAVCDYPRYTVTVKRKNTYHLITVIFPMVLTSALIPLVFLIPANTGEKLSYLVAIFTSTAVFFNYISDVIPRSVSRMPYLAVLLIEVLVEGLLATLASIMIVNIAVEEGKYQISKVQPTDNANPHEASSSTETNSKDKVSPPNESAIAYRSRRVSSHVTSRMLDKICFTIFIISQTGFLILLFCYLDWI